MLNKNNKLDNNKYIFDNINNWINNVDNKISILLAFLVAIIGYIITDNKILCSNILTTLLTVIVLILLLYSCLLCIYALKGRIKSKINYTSMIFFGSISKMDRKEYYDKLSEYNEKKLNEDIRNQIYINSCICSWKYKLYNIALNCLIISFFIMSIVFIIILLKKGDNISIVLK